MMRAMMWWSIGHLDNLCISHWLFVLISLSIIPTERRVQQFTNYEDDYDDGALKISIWFQQQLARPCVRSKVVEHCTNIGQLSRNDYHQHHYCTGCPKINVLMEQNHYQNWVRWSYTWPWTWLVGAWSCLVLVSKKRPKTTFQAQVSPTIGGWACAPWLQQHSISTFFGTPCRYQWFV